MTHNEKLEQQLVDLYNYVFESYELDNDNEIVEIIDREEVTDREAYVDEFVDAFEAVTEYLQANGNVVEHDFGKPNPIVTFSLLENGDIQMVIPAGSFSDDMDW